MGLVLKQAYTTPSPLRKDKQTVYLKNNKRKLDTIKLNIKLKKLTIKDIATSVISQDVKGFRRLLCTTLHFRFSS